MELSEIVEIQELTDKNKVNELLSQGWRLIDVVHVDEGVPGYQYFKYSLGLTERTRSYLKNPLPIDF
ncbi:MAG: hypothetical protein RR588_00230 [Solibacillus sp.]